MTDITLPGSATAASRQRAQRAAELVAACPPAIADVIALVGSTARGVADDESDLELNLWATAIPPHAERVGWLRSAGATTIQVEAAPRPDDSHWIAFSIGGVSAEVGWQTFAALDATLDRVLSGAALDRKTLAFAYIVTTAIPLRGDQQLAAWQARLANYSDAVQRGIVGMALAQWSQPARWAAARRLARHGERLALTEHLLQDLDMAVRLLYAVHRRWEPGKKWTLTVAQGFAPDNLSTRIDAALGDPALERRVTLCAALCRDVLALVPAPYDVAAAVAALP